MAQTTARTTRTTRAAHHLRLLRSRAPLVRPAVMNADARAVAVERALIEIEREVGRLDLHQRLAIERTLDQLGQDYATLADTRQWWDR